MSAGVGAGGARASDAGPEASHTGQVAAPEAAGIALPVGGPAATRRHRSARSPDGFYGWRIVAASSAAVVLTAPGQTAAVSAFIEPMLGDLGLSRTALSTAYLIGTLTGAAAMPAVGRALDRYGIRRTMAVIGALFGAFLIGLSTVSGIVGVTAGFVGIRMAGQGALGLAATTATALWFTRRRGVAVGIVSAVGAAGISLAPVVLERLVTAYGWRAVWAGEGVLVWLTVIPLALLVMRDRPEQLGQRPDGVPYDAHAATGVVGLTRAAAVRTGWFWLVTAAVSVSGMLATAVAFHQISLLGERGLSTTAAAANFLPQTAAALFATFTLGALVDRVSPSRALAGCMLLLAAGLAWGTVVTPGLSAIGFGLTIGAAGGSVRTLEAATVPRVFGTAHLGAIRGLITAFSIGSTAFGPVLFAVVQETAGSYRPVLAASAVLPLLVAVAALRVRSPALTRPAPTA
ncbi:MAG: MFS transporter [Mycobacteriales bacterium]